MALDMTGEYVLTVPRDTVWIALNDPELLQRCVPGCESFDKLSDTEFSVVCRLVVGVVKARFKGKIRLQDLNPPYSYTILGEGEGGIAGFAKGEAAVVLTETGESTILKYRAQTQIGGKLAQLGQRLVAGTAKKLADRFFANFVAALVATPSDDQVRETLPNLG